MACVFSDEIEALLAGGPPAIDWDAITEELKRDFLSYRDQECYRGSISGGDEVLDREPVRTALPPSFVAVSKDGGSCVEEYCDKFPCLRARDVAGDLVVDRPVVVIAGTGEIPLKELGAPWVTFSKESVLELNKMGVDCTFTCHRAVGKTFAGAVIYRGSADSEALVRSLASVTLSCVRGVVTYATAHTTDSSVLAKAFMHMFANGGRVCGHERRGMECALCGDTGIIVGELCGTVRGEDVVLPYCVCGAGHRREVKDDEDFEHASGAYIMGRYDGGDTPERTWSDDEREYQRGSSHSLSVSDLPYVGYGGLPVDESDFPEFVGIAGEWHALLRAGPELDDVVGGTGTPLESDGHMLLRDGVVWAVVMPPAHGKSIHHGEGKLREADALCHPRATAMLSRLRDKSRVEPNVMPEYVEAWASHLRAAAEPGDVVMVPDVDIACAAGFQVLGALLLEEPAWSINLVGRSEHGVARARECYESVARADGVTKYWCANNGELTACLRRLCAGVEESHDDGQCYAQVMKEDRVEVARVELSYWPTFGQLLRYDSAAFDIQACRDAMLVDMGGGKYHVSKAGGGLMSTNSFLDCVVRRVANTTAPFAAASLGGLAASLHSVSAGPAPELSDRLGGAGELGPYLAELAGAPDHRFDPGDLGIVGSSAALLGPAQKKRLKMFEALGDSVLSTDVARRCLREGRTNEEYQNARSAVTSNPSLSRLFVATVPVGMVTFVSGIKPGEGRVGACVIEAWLGLVYNELGADAVASVCSGLGVYSLYSW